MRWLLSLTVALITAAFCNLAYSQMNRYPFTWWLPSDEQLGKVWYEDLSATKTSPFFELAPGVLALEVEDDRFASVLGSARAVADLDGDGVLELAVAGYAPSGCGNDVRGDLRVFSGAGLTPIGRYSGYSHFGLETLSNGDVLERRSYGWRGPSLSVRPTVTGPSRWMRDWTDSSDIAAVGDLNGDGLDEIAVGDALADGADGRSAGAVTVLDGSDGSLLWCRVGQVYRDWFGNDMAPAGDWDRDGVDDIAAISHHGIHLLSGVDGVPIETVEVELERRPGLWNITAVGDLDGDDQVDFRLRIEGLGPERYTYPIVTLRPDRGGEPYIELDVTDGWELEWWTPVADWKSEGDALILGRRHPETGERRVSSYSQFGLFDLDVDLGLDSPIASDWENVKLLSGAVVRFDPTDPTSPRHLLVSARRDVRKYYDLGFLLMTRLD